MLSLQWWTLSVSQHDTNIYRLMMEICVWLRRSYQGAWQDKRPPSGFLSNTGLLNFSHETSCAHFKPSGIELPAKCDTDVEHDNAAVLVVTWIEKQWQLLLEGSCQIRHLTCCSPVEEWDNTKLDTISLFFFQWNASSREEYSKHLLRRFHEPWVFFSPPRKERNTSGNSCLPLQSRSIIHAKWQ